MNHVRALLFIVLFAACVSSSQLTRSQPSTATDLYYTTSNCSFTQLIFNEMLQPQALCLIRISSSLPFSCMTAISANYTTVSFQRLRLVFLPWKQAFSHPPRLASYRAQAVRSQIVIHLVRPWSLCSSLASHRWQRSCFSCKYLIAFT